MNSQIQEAEIRKNTFGSPSVVLTIHQNKSRFFLISERTSAVSEFHFPELPNLIIFPLDFSENGFPIMNGEEISRLNAG